MSDSVWETGKLTAVYHPVGNTSRGEPRYRRANYDVLEWVAPGATKVETYVVNPPSDMQLTNDDINARAVDEHHPGRDFGFYNLESIVIEPHEGNGSDAGWKGVTSFGYI